MHVCIYSWVYGHHGHTGIYAYMSLHTFIYIYKLYLYMFVHMILYTCNPPRSRRSPYRDWPSHALMVFSLYMPRLATARGLQPMRFVGACDRRAQTRTPFSTPRKLLDMLTPRRLRETAVTAISQDAASFYNTEGLGKTGWIDDWMSGMEGSEEPNRRPGNNEQSGIFLIHTSCTVLLLCRSS